MERKERSVEDGVKKAHSMRKLEAKSGIGDLAFDFERTKAFVIEFLRRACCSNIASVEPNLGTRNEFGGSRSAKSVRRSSILSLSYGDFILKVLMKFGEIVSEIVGAGIGNSNVHRNRSSRIITIVSKEGRNLSGRVSGIVVSEFGER